MIELQTARRVGGWAVSLLLVSLTAYPPNRLTAQAPPVDALILRFASWTAVSGLEQAATDSLLTLLPGSVRDRTGDVTVTLGRGAPRRLVSCVLDEPGYVVGNITDDGYLTLRRVGRVTATLYDQYLEGHRVTLFGARRAVPGVVGVKSTHLTRGRTASDQPFMLDNAYVDIGAASSDDVRALGIDVLTPVALTKRPHRYGPDLVAAPAAGRRAGCAALAAAVLSRPRIKGTVVVAFTVLNVERGSPPGLGTVKALLGPFDEAKEFLVAARYAETPVETVSLSEARSVLQQIVAWMEAR